MDLDAQALSVPDLLAGGASAQLAALAAAIGGVLLGTVLAAVGVRWVARRCLLAEAGAKSCVEQPLESAGDRCETVSNLRLAAASMLAVFLMPAAAAIRQLWPHPDLGWAMVACWFAVLLPVLAIWFVLGRAVFAGSSTRRPPA